MNETEKDLLHDFLVWVYEQKKFGFSVGTDTEHGMEWVPVVGPNQTLVAEYAQFLDERGPAVQAFARYGWHMVDWNSLEPIGWPAHNALGEPI